MQSKYLAWQLNHEAFIHCVSVLVNILVQPRVSLHQKQMVLPTLPTCLKSKGQKVFGELQSYLEMSQAVFQLFCNLALASLIFCVTASSCHHLFYSGWGGQGGKHSQSKMVRLCLLSLHNTTLDRLEGVL